MNEEVRGVSQSGKEDKVFPILERRGESRKRLLYLVFWPGDGCVMVCFDTFNTATPFLLTWSRQNKHSIGRHANLRTHSCMEATTLTRCG